MSRTPRVVHLRHRNFPRLRHSRHFQAWLEEQAVRLEMTAEQIFNKMKQEGLSAKQVEALEPEEPVDPDEPEDP